MANWDTVIADCDDAIAEIASTQRPRTITYDGQTVTCYHIEDAQKIRDYAEHRKSIEASGGDSSSQVEME